MAETARYLYVISRELSADALGHVSGLRGMPLEVVSHRGLHAVVSDVPLSEFDEAGLKHNLESLPWLEEVARGHDEVVRTVGASASVAPLRLATICLDDHGVRQRLDEWHDDLHRVLDRVEGCVEWSVKVIMPPEADAPDPGREGPTSGAAYLRRKKADRERRDARLATSAGLGEAIHRDLTELTTATRLLPAQDPQLAGYVGTMILNGAYLVETTAGDSFRHRVEDLARAHPEVHVDLAGPWPAYSFAVLDPS